jgi:hypothetical protein
MALMDEIMPTVASAGLTQSQVVNALRNNKEMLLKFRNQEKTVSSESVLKIFDSIKKYGSLANMVGYRILAISAGCTYQQAKTIVGEIFDGVDYIEENNLW